MQGQSNNVLLGDFSMSHQHTLIRALTPRMPSQNMYTGLLTTLLAVFGAVLGQGNSIEEELSSDTAKGLPECAIPCINSAITSTGCRPMDVSTMETLL